ncbi:MAG: nucleotidyltransferase [Blautia sp.]|nr:nucleotidyltransferase [Blautia sp.]
MKKTALVIMAAGIGSRFGKGIKQLAPVGPTGQIIMDYSIHDALEAGFNKVVFIIRRDLYDEFREIIGDRIAEKTEVAYAFQELSDLPEGFSLPEGRTKPWGTGQAVLAAADVLTEPFMVINADDYYGKEAYRLVHDYLAEGHGEDDSVRHICMAGFRLGNTLSEHGGVTRGICCIENGCLAGVTETRNIFKTPEGAEIRDGDERIPADTENLVSMNMWGLTPDFVEILKKGFVSFLADDSGDPLKKEYLLPTLIDQLIRSGQIKVDVLETADEWFGVTYQEDKEAVAAAFRKLTDEGIYPEHF